MKTVLSLVEDGRCLTYLPRQRLRLFTVNHKNRCDRSYYPVQSPFAKPALKMKHGQRKHMAEDINPVIFCNLTAEFIRLQIDSNLVLHGLFKIHFTVCQH